MNKMKNLLLAAICLIATSTVTSCLDSDGDSKDYTMTPEETATYLTRLSGTYTGKMLFHYRGRKKYVQQDSMMRDSIMNMTWRINRDSTITIANFPDSIFNNAITGNNDLRNILKKAPTRPTLNCIFAPYKFYNNAGTADYAFQILPKAEVDEKNTQYAYTQSQFSVDNKDYTAKYGYALNLYDGYYQYQSYGYQTKNGEIEIVLCVGDVKCTNTSGGHTTVPYQVLFSGIKMY